ncbi:unnamed protein product [Symbiodinium natans]|uniref:MIB/HERC2 domain-containing protein n=1 Tax=Symbiodinium natans TaxID=878477 RepID=A0A812JZU6_9DINO|nr:unnamed protein product [Symbiodinium natans]
MQGQPVSEQLVTLGATVQRGPDWRYSADEDGGPRGVGIVMGWRSADGQASGPEDAVPAHRGWVRVQWQVTGYCKNYRLGSSSSSVSDLMFAFPQDPAVTSLDAVPKGSLQLHHLRCTFGYPCGLKYPHYAKFDVRPEACLKVANFVPGDIVTSSQAMGVRSTCIGLKYNSQANKAKWKQSQVDMWFHNVIGEGAGLFPGDLDRDMQLVGRTEVQEAQPGDLESASDGEIEHDEQEWVSNNLAPSLRYVTKGDQPLHVDTRTEL